MTDDRQLLRLLFDAAVAAASPAACVPLWLEGKPGGRVIVVGAGKAAASMAAIVEQVWGYGGRGDKELVRGLVRRLRTKVEPEPGHPRYVLTSPGVGYCFGPHEG